MAVNDTWIRTQNKTPFVTSPQDIDFASIPLNDTLLRVHGAVSVIMTLPAHSKHADVESVNLIAGIYTTLTVGGTLLHPVTQSGDQAPPLQRWLWWENMHAVAQPPGGTQYPDSRQVWQFTPAQNPIDIKAQVRATTAIDLHLAVETSVFLPELRQFEIWWWFSVLRSGT